jgi:hypothetical protein
LRGFGKKQSKGAKSVLVRDQLSVSMRAKLGGEDADRRE